jgi:hypothetical protein
LSIRIQIGNSKRGENVISRARAGDFSRFTIAASAEVKDLSVLFYTSILDRLSKNVDLWLQIQSSYKWVKKKNLALAVKKPAVEMTDSLLFQIEGKEEIDSFLYKFWYRGPLRFYLGQSMSQNTIYETIRSFASWPDIQEFHRFFPEPLAVVVDLDIWGKFLDVLIPTEDASIVNEALQCALPLLNHPVASNIVGESLKLK